MSESSSAATKDESDTIQAVIYCRSATRSRPGEQGLSSQEMCCREYAASKGYEVRAVFYDDGVSGAKLDRSGMQQLLDFVNSVRDQTPVVLIRDISRLARDIRVHIQLREAIEAAGAKLECPSFEFGDTPESHFAENLFAARAQLEQKIEESQSKNVRRVFSVRKIVCGVFRRRRLREHHS